MWGGGLLVSREMGEVMKDQDCQDETKNDLEKRLTILENNFQKMYLQGGLRMNSALRFPIGAEVVGAYSILGGPLGPLIGTLPDVILSGLPTLKSGVKEVITHGGVGGPSIFGYSTSTGFVTVPEIHPLTQEPNSPLNITVKFKDGTTQDHTVQPGGKYKLTNGDFVLFN